MAHGTHHSFKKQGHKDHDRKLAHYKSGGGVEDGPKAHKANPIKKAVHQHERNMHADKAPTHLKLATGGGVQGDKVAGRRDRPGRATGGPAKKSGGKSGHGNHVNVIVAGGGPKPGMAPGGPPIMPPGAPPMAPHPPAAPPPMMPPGAGMGGGPPGMGGGMPPPRPPMAPPGGGMPMRADGGRVGRADGGKVHLTGGSKSGVGRMEKAHAEGRAHHAEGKGETENFENKPAAGQLHEE